MSHFTYVPTSLKTLLVYVHKLAAKLKHPNYVIIRKTHFWQESDKVSDW